MDAEKAADRWNRWDVRGTAEQIAAVLSGLDATLPAGWSRLTGDAAARYRTPAWSEAAWFEIATTTAHVGVVLGVARPRDTELRGGRVWFAGPPSTSPPPTVPAAWDQINRFLDEGIVPAAKAAGAQVRIPTAEEVFLADLPFDTQDRLIDFARAAKKSLPMTADDAELWRQFVVAAFRGTAVVPARPFIDWLVANGWRSEDAAELSLRFFDQTLLLSRYTREVFAA